MNLCVQPPEEQLRQIEGLLEGEKICYCAPFDLTSDGKIIKGAFVSVSRSRLILTGPGIQSVYLLKDFARLECQMLINNAVLVGIDKNGRECLLARFRTANALKFSYIARGANLFINGEDRVVVSRERENICPKCGRGLHGANYCSHCEGRGRTFKRILSMARPHIKDLIFVSVIMVIITGINVGARFAEKELVDEVIMVNGPLSEAYKYILIMIALTAAVIVCYVLRNYLSARLGTSISMDLRKRLYEKIQALSIGFISGERPGALMNRMTQDTQQIRRFMENTFAMMFNQVLTMLGSIIVMFIMDWRLSLMILALMPVIILFTAYFRRINKIFHKQWMASDEVNSQLQDVLSGIRVVKAFGTEQRETLKFSTGNAKVAHITQRAEKLWATLYPIFELIFGLSTVLVILYGGINVLNGSFTMGEITMFTFYSAALYGCMRWLGNMPRMVISTLISIDRIYSVLDEEETIVNRENAVTRQIEGRISIKDVYFGYNAYETVLEGISLEIKQGEMIGLVGASGTGKSTLINLIMRMYDVDAGEIDIDGIDIRDYDKECLHRQIGVVLQEPFLFSGSVLDNIKYSKPEATYEEVIRAAKLANAHDFVIKFPDGYDTKVGENGHNLSGGERQRIAIARAVLCDPKILILDEATSSLDTETEYQIQEALARLIKGRTTIAIAHRLSTLRGADRIMVIDKKKRAELGTHDELLRQRGIYYNLVMAQLQMGKLDSA